MRIFGNCFVAIFMELSLVAMVSACGNPLDSIKDDTDDTGDVSALVTGAPNPADHPDGWAQTAGAPAAPGGSGAGTANIYTVTTKAEFLRALKAGGIAVSDVSKIIYVTGMIDLCTNGSGAELSANDFIIQAGLQTSYSSYADYVAKYAASCATNMPSTLAAHRNALYAKQKAVVVVAVGSNTSILGIGDNAGFKNGSLSVSSKTNVVIRNVAVQDAYDYFPAWDESENLINSEYDNIVVSGSTYIWIDHCLLGDGDRPDASIPKVTISGTAKSWVTHDGLLDIVRGADRVTVSWNKIMNHDKTMLIGNSDTSTTDTGKLETTIHHNYFDGARQRLPRVRFGRVHVYNNYYANVGSYAVGVGDKSRIYSEANYFDGVSNAFAKFDDTLNEGYFIDIGSNLVNGSEMKATSALVGWNPADFYTYSVQSATEARVSVLSDAGTGRF